MSKFHVQWTSGSRSIETAEAATADAYAMERWGMNSAAQVFDDYGVKITLLSDGDALGEPSELNLSPAAAKTASILASKQVAALQQ